MSMIFNILRNLINIFTPYICSLFLKMKEPLLLLIVLLLLLISLLLFDLVNRNTQNLVYGFTSIKMKAQVIMICKLIHKTHVKYSLSNSLFKILAYAYNMFRRTNFIHG